MLATVAFCSVLFDFQGLWVSLMPDEMQAQLHREWGMDPWDTEVQAVMANALGAAAEGDANAAFFSMHTAEKVYDSLNPDEIAARMGECLDVYRAAAEK